MDSLRTEIRVDSEGIKKFGEMMQWLSNSRNSREATFTLIGHYAKIVVQFDVDPFTRGQTVGSFRRQGVDIMSVLTDTSKIPSQSRFMDKKQLSQGLGSPIQPEGRRIKVVATVQDLLKLMNNFDKNNEGNPVEDLWKFLTKKVQMQKGKHYTDERGK